MTEPGRVASGFATPPLAERANGPVGQIGQGTGAGDGSIEQGSSRRAG